MIIALIAIVIIVILGVMLLNNNKKESDEVGKTEKSATKEDVKIVANEASKLTLEEYKTDNFTNLLTKNVEYATIFVGTLYKLHLSSKKYTFCNTFYFFTIL